MPNSAVAFGLRLPAAAANPIWKYASDIILPASPVTQVLMMFVHCAGGVNA